MNIADFINSIFQELNPLTASLSVALTFTLAYDFYHLLFEAVTSFFRK